MFDLSDRSFEIFGQRWEMLFRDRVPTVGGKRSDGVCMMPDRTIIIRRNLAPLRMVEVVIHELKHAHDWGKDESVIADQALLETTILHGIGLIKDTIHDA